MKITSHYRCSDNKYLKVFQWIIIINKLTNDQHFQVFWVDIRKLIMHCLKKLIYGCNSLKDITSRDAMLTNIRKKESANNYCSELKRPPQHTQSQFVARMSKMSSIEENVRSKMNTAEILRSQRYYNKDVIEHCSIHKNIFSD